MPALQRFNQLPHDASQQNTLRRITRSHPWTCRLPGQMDAFVCLHSFLKALTVMELRKVMNSGAQGEQNRPQAAGGRGAAGRSKQRLRGNTRRRTRHQSPLSHRETQPQNFPRTKHWGHQQRPWQAPETLRPHVPIPHCQPHTWPRRPLPPSTMVGNGEAEPEAGWPLRVDVGTAQADLASALRAENGQPPQGPQDFLGGIRPPPKETLGPRHAGCPALQQARLSALPSSLSNKPCSARCQTASRPH